MSFITLVVILKLVFNNFCDAGSELKIQSCPSLKFPFSRFVLQFEPHKLLTPLMQNLFTVFLIFLLYIFIKMINLIKVVKVKHFKRLSLRFCSASNIHTEMRFTVFVKANFIQNPFIHVYKNTYIFMFCQM